MKSRARVLMIVENTSYPLDRRVCHEATSLLRAGCEVSVIAPAVRKQKFRENVDGVEVYRYWQPSIGSGLLGYFCEYTVSLLATALLSLRIILRSGFDVIHAANPPDFFPAIAGIYKIVGKKFIFDHHDLAPEMYDARYGSAARRTIRRVLRAWEYLSCRLADHVIATNESYKRIDMVRNRVPAEKITVVRNGPDLETASEANPDPIQCRAGKLLIGYAGVIGKQDGAEHLIHALDYLKHSLSRSDFTCVVIGGGDGLPDIQRLAKALELDDCIEWMGWVQDPAKYAAYLSALDICVAPEPSNPYNDASTIVKLLEYMAMSKPIVAFDLPEHRVSAENAALFAKPNNDAALAHAINELIEDPVRRHELGSAGRRRIETNLAWCHSVQHLYAAYSKVLGKEVRETASIPIPSPRTNSTFGSTFKPRAWFKRRDCLYIGLRSLALLNHYRFTPRKGEERVRRMVKFLAQYGCSPTLPAPGRVVEKYSDFCRSLQDAGCELAIHGYDHLDFNTLSEGEIKDQFELAIEAFEKNKIVFDGFRCPYLSFTDAATSVVPSAFRYSSNQAVWWDSVPNGWHRSPTAVFNRLQSFYRAHSSDDVVAVPHTNGFVEIPASVPDDIQLRSGLHMTDHEIAATWLRILRKVQQRGESFVVLFHPETFDESEYALGVLLETVNSDRQLTWLTQLKSIAEWWKEKNTFGVEVIRDHTTDLHFHCSDRATILVRGFDDRGTLPWADPYRLLPKRCLRLNRNVKLPFIGVDSKAPEDRINLLREQGYIVLAGETPQSCEMYLDTTALSGSSTDLIARIDDSSCPLVRYWRWPNGHRSALAITGDLDALSLVDYARRIAA